MDSVTLVDITDDDGYRLYLNKDPLEPPHIMIVSDSQTEGPCFYLNNTTAAALRDGLAKILDDQEM